ncbi:MAG: hypothetical protein HYW70_02415 [Candidatus Nealsonbacteria bacterium]|nr:hypothetical protein [Candidatus Nealsonbacteria bacterium]
MSEISQPTKQLIERYQYWSQMLTPPEGIPKIHVDEVASGVASFYEKIRGVIEWREEHLLRKSAIERILRRRLTLKKDGEIIAEALVMELIRGGHFPNDNLPQTKIGEINTIINKYVYIIDGVSRKSQNQKADIFNWISAIAASEIEACLAPPIREGAIIDYMTALMKERIRTKEGILVFGGLTEEEKNLQTYIACQRALFKLDTPTIVYHLFKKLYLDWDKPEENTLGEISQNILELKSKIEKAISHPWSERFYQLCEKYDTSYLILGDIISKNPAEAHNIQNPEFLENAAKEAYGERFSKLKKRLARAAFYSTLSIFITKIFSALIIEIPFDMYITGEFSYRVLLINIIMPPLLMFLLVSTIRTPKKSNLQKVIMEVFKITYERESKDIYEIKKPAKRGTALRIIIAFFYTLGFMGSFGVVIWALKELNFGILSMGIFLLFLTLISYAGVKLRQRAKELVIEEGKERFLNLVIDFFSLPIIRVGKWLSHQWERYNAVVIIFNSLIDLPFQVFVEFLEQWRYFLKEKKEEIH